MKDVFEQMHRSELGGESIKGPAPNAPCGQSRPIARAASAIRAPRKKGLVRRTRPFRIGGGERDARRRGSVRGSDVAGFLDQGPELARQILMDEAKTHQDIDCSRVEVKVNRSASSRPSRLEPEVVAGNDHVHEHKDHGHDAYGKEAHAARLQSRAEGTNPRRVRCAWRLGREDRDGPWRQFQPGASLPLQAS